MKTTIALFGLFFLSSCQNNPLGTESKSGSNFYPGLGIAPTISSISPNNGPVAGGTNITLTGRGFTSQSKIKIGGTLCTQTTFYSPTKAVCMTPSHTIGVKDISIENLDQQKSTLAAAYTYSSNILGKPGFGINSGGIRAVGTTVSLSPSIGEPIQGDTMLGVTTQLRTGVKSIIFNPAD